MEEVGAAGKAMVDAEETEEGEEGEDGSAIVPLVVMVACAVTDLSGVYTITEKKELLLKIKKQGMLCSRK